MFYYSRLTFEIELTHMQNDKLDVISQAVEVIHTQAVKQNMIDRWFRVGGLLQRLLVMICDATLDFGDSSRTR